VKPNLTDTLCTRCGLCCDGSLFADVELAGTDEASALEVMGLEIEDDEDDRSLLLQPCVALSGKCCSIYELRPGCCRTFECRLLQEAKRGVVSVDRAREEIAGALRRIERVRELIRQLGRDKKRLPLKERCAEALAFVPKRGGNSERDRIRDELEIALADMERLMRETFLGARLRRE
jgi:uncharacterized protein